MLFLLFPRFYQLFEVFVRCSLTSFNSFFCTFNLGKKRVLCHWFDMVVSNVRFMQKAIYLPDKFYIISFHNPLDGFEFFLCCCHVLKILDSSKKINLLGNPINY